ncbi:AAA family ATPase [Bifidobacterium sp. SO4]|uniref:AAA family ATPase n=1 Tax=Bifidobacterium sp. SO4 TaxID=2809030 RepID=UPI001BDCA9B8|nr:AAA family ATPase [Bifidobacterium sp. SO4]MBT1169597.1 AAA family ATPase [Bifidobacterium sp. SO4]
MVTIAASKDTLRRTALVEEAMKAAETLYADVMPERGEHIGDSINRTAEGIPCDPETGKVGADAIRITKGARSVSLLDLREIKTKPLQFLWYPWLRPGLNVLAGKGGSRKSTFAAYIVAKATNGELADDHGKKCGKLRVLYIDQGEDDLASVLVPRMKAQGADLELVRLLRVTTLGAFGTETTVMAGKQDLEAIKRIVAEWKPELIVFDPLSLLVNGDINSYQDVQPALVACNELAQLSEGCAVLGLHHWNKEGKFTGSQKFEDTSRSFMEIAADPDDDMASVVSLSKANNSGKLSIRLTAKLTPFKTDDGGTTTVQTIDHVEESIITVEDIRQTLASGTNAEERSEIEQWIVDYLMKQPNREALANTIINEGFKVAGYTRDQLKRAKKKVAVSKKSSEFQGAWVWHLIEGRER